MGIHAFDIRLRSAGVRRHQAAIRIEEPICPDMDRSASAGQTLGKSEPSL
jgi:hypothetical protein